MLLSILFLKRIDSISLKPSYTIYAGTYVQDASIYGTYVQDVSSRREHVNASSIHKLFIKACTAQLLSRNQTLAGDDERRLIEDN